MERDADDVERLRAIYCALLLSHDLGGAGPTAPPVGVERLLMALSDRYGLRRSLGSGGQAKVLLVEDFAEVDDFAAFRALKLRPFTGADEDEQVYYRHSVEAHAYQCVEHVSIPRVHAQGVIDGTGCYIVLDHVHGQDLAEVLAREGQARISERELLGGLAEVAGAAHALHIAGFSHRDIKPGNIRRRVDGRFFLIDLGLARGGTPSDHLSRTGDVVGTYRYMAPEQLEGQVSQSAAHDIWALGLCLYELLTGELPFKGENAADRLRSIQRTRNDRIGDLSIEDDGLRAIVQRCLRLEPRRRYRSALALREELVRWLAEQPVRTRTSRLVEVSRHFTRRHGRPVAALLVVLLAGAWLLWSRNRDNFVQATESDLRAGFGHLAEGNSERARDSFESAEANRSLAERVAEGRYLLGRREVSGRLPVTDASRIFSESVEAAESADARERRRGLIGLENALLVARGPARVFYAAELARAVEESLVAPVDTAKRVVQTLTTDPVLTTFADPWYRAGRLTRRKWPEEAVQYFRRALELNPDRETYCLGLSNALVDTGDLQEALELCKGLTSERARAHRAYVYLKSDEWDACRELCDELIDECGNPKAYSYKAWVLGSRGAWDEAFAVLKEGVERNPDEIDLMLKIGYVEDIGLGRKDEGFARVVEAYRMSSTPKELKQTLELLTPYYTGRMRLTRAMGFYREAFESNSLDPNTLQVTALGASLTGRPFSSGLMYGMAIGMDPDNQALLIRVADDLLEEDDAHTAGTLLDAARRLDPTAVEVVLKQADVALHEQRFEDARALASEARALSGDPDHKAARLVDARLALERGAFEEARQLARGVRGEDASELRSEVLAMRRAEKKSRRDPECKSCNEHDLLLRAVAEARLGRPDRAYNFVARLIEARDEPASLLRDGLQYNAACFAAQASLLADDSNERERWLAQGLDSFEAFGETLVEVRESSDDVGLVLDGLRTLVFAMDDPDLQPLRERHPDLADRIDSVARETLVGD